MKRAWAVLLACSATIMISCSWMNISLTRSSDFLTEVVLEGTGRDKILMIDISGFISISKQSRGSRRARAGVVTFIKHVLDKAEKDENIKGVILRINSPGGSVTASDIAYHELEGYKERTGMTVYASILGIGTSGGYYVALAADRIYAHPTAITGSIGVISTKLDKQGLFEKLGVKNEIVKSGDRKDMFRAFRPYTPEEHEILQRIIDALFARFVDTIEEARAGILTREDIIALADGRPYTAQQALELGLIDEIEYFDRTLCDLKEELGLDQVKLVRYVPASSQPQTIYSESAGLPAAEDLSNLDADVFQTAQGVDFLYLWPAALP